MTASVFRFSFLLLFNNIVYISFTFLPVFKFSLTVVNSVGMREARVCLHVDSVAENWFAFLVLSTYDMIAMNIPLNLMIR